MIYREFREKKLSGLGLGMMRLPVVEGDDASIDMARTAEIIDYAYQNGINYFDTAWGYHNGNSELAAGRVLALIQGKATIWPANFPAMIIPICQK